MKDAPTGWMMVWFGWKANAIRRHLRNPEPLVTNVLSGARGH